MIDLNHKNAFITGSSRGIGQQIALGLAQLGCNIIVHGRKKENCTETLKRLEAYNVRTYSVYGDLSHPNDIDSIISQVTELDIPVDILYNNAAVMTPYREDYWSHTFADWNLSMTVNVYAVYKLCAAFMPLMINRGFGRVVNLTSGINGQPELLPYSVSKSAVIKLTKDMAVKVATTAVRINTLDPTWLRTDLGGEYADNPVEAVLPGALKPVLIPNNGPNGENFIAVD
jgi:NAD(P)-dependent dehydrogenase (short-subunit alcohol dehydrogenase family)